MMYKYNSLHVIYKDRNVKNVNFTLKRKISSLNS